MNRIRLSAWVAAVIWIAGWGDGASAQTFGFSPTVLEMDASKNLVAQTILINSTSGPARFSIVARAWKIVNGQSVLEETRDLIVNPTSFTVKPGASQVIRVGVRKKPGAQELAYRIIVQQEALEGVPLPTVKADLGKDSKAALGLSLGFSLPVYVTPPGSAAKLALTTSRGTEGTLLTFENSGNRRAVIRDLSIATGDQKLSMQTFAVLAGSSYQLNASALKASGPSFTLSYTADDGRKVVETLQFP
ncbi:molecular chaperone [Deinococcus oregonensis]|uniref:Molecular chaperone n=1 Tax=Deinococcus oregonensis TaxID=1805970 RepID=A0ABV6AXU7_9DEIO